MLRALELAQEVRGRTWPNPMVGCVVVRDGIILAEGQTQRCGEDHAEADALRKIDFRAEGATIYVNLEPCCHWGRTPPCTDAIIRSGATRVVVGAQDPHPLVDGKGIEALRAAGIAVDVGLHEDAGRALNEAHWISFTEHRPFVTLKAAVTLDGRTATRNHESKWITGEGAREHSRRERGLHQAVLIGVGTVLEDDPQLNVRLKPMAALGTSDPIRVVLDSSLRTPPSARLLTSPGGEVWICTTEAALGTARADALEAAGARLIGCDGDERVDLRDVLAKLNAEQIATLFVEGGATVHGAFVDANLVDRWLIYVAPKIFGGADALPLALGQGVLHPGDALKLAPLAVTPLGDDILIESRSADGPAAAFWTQRHGHRSGS
jgi:diaminohydroxyphosphoribosylaminopyrimidine deaminase/5-amino-6-(5-phosphoribosylamino)uracil reductase